MQCRYVAKWWHNKRSLLHFGADTANIETPTLTSMMKVTVWIERGVWLTISNSGVDLIVARRNWDHDE